MCRRSELACGQVCGEFGFILCGKGQRLHHEQRSSCIARAATSSDATRRPGARSSVHAGISQVHPRRCALDGANRRFPCSHRATDLHRPEHRISAVRISWLAVEHAAGGGHPAGGSQWRVDHRSRRHGADLSASPRGQARPHDPSLAAITTADSGAAGPTRAQCS